MPAARNRKTGYFFPPPDFSRHFSGHFLWHFSGHFWGHFLGAVSRPTQSAPVGSPSDPSQLPCPAIPAQNPPAPLGAALVAAGVLGCPASRCSCRMTPRAEPPPPRRRGWMRLGAPGHSVVYDRHGTVLAARRLPTKCAATCATASPPTRSFQTPTPPRTPPAHAACRRPRPAWRLDVPASDDPFRRHVTAMLRADFPHLCSAMDVEHIAAALAPPALFFAPPDSSNV